MTPLEDSIRGGWATPIVSFFFLCSVQVSAAPLNPVRASNNLIAERQENSPEEEVCNDERLRPGTRTDGTGTACKQGNQRPSGASGDG
jgi:hypothetical protein